MFCSKGFDSCKRDTWKLIRSPPFTFDWQYINHPKTVNRTRNGRKKNEIFKIHEKPFHLLACRGLIKTNNEKPGTQTFVIRFVITKRKKCTKSAPKKKHIIHQFHRRAISHQNDRTAARKRHSQMKNTALSFNHPWISLVKTKSKARVGRCAFFVAYFRSLSLSLALIHSGIRHSVCTDAQLSLTECQCVHFANRN